MHSQVDVIIKPPFFRIRPLFTAFCRLFQVSVFYLRWVKSDFVGRVIHMDLGKITCVPFYCLQRRIFICYLTPIVMLITRQRLRGMMKNDYMFDGSETMC
ncbi:hypothetical protein BX666DRAFT_1921051 [Dichotomocladium elegans]|nr:hypothetical protein BX666DRAFT_1921051 [Dichotomocladium elegans]